MILIRCDRCATVSPPDEHCTWMRLNVSPSEAEHLAVAGDQIDLCDACEQDLVRFMAGEAFHRFLEDKP